MKQSDINEQLFKDYVPWDRVLAIANDGPDKLLELKSNV